MKTGKYFFGELVNIKSKIKCEMFFFWFSGSIEIYEETAPKTGFCPPTPSLPLA